MKLLGLDLETGNKFKNDDGSQTSLDDTCITEVGLVMYDTDIGYVPVDIYGALVNEGKGVHEDAVKYTGITPEMVEKYGKDPKEVCEKIMEMLKECDYVVAQNGNEFDKPRLLKFLLRYLGKDAFEGFEPIHWIDTLTDIEYPSNIRSKSLGALAAAHLILNCFPHRAITDVLTMMAILFKYDLKRTLEVSKSPQVILKARAPIDIDPSKKKNAFNKGTAEYAEMERWKSLVKDRGFRWDGDAEVTGEKCWYKKTKEIFLKEGKEDSDDLVIVKITDASDVF